MAQCRPEHFSTTGGTFPAWPKYWSKIEDVFPTSPPKTSLTLRLDADMAAWFRGQGRGYQARMNAVLRAYMLARKTKLQCQG